MRASKRMAISKARLYYHAARSCRMMQGSVPQGAQCITYAKLIGELFKVGRKQEYETGGGWLWCPWGSSFCRATCSGWGEKPGRGCYGNQSRLLRGCILPYSSLPGDALCVTPLGYAGSNVAIGVWRDSLCQHGPCSTLETNVMRFLLIYV